MPSEDADKLKGDGRSEDDASGSPPRIFDRRFEILALLGEGASGKVYKARDIIMDRLVALKILHQHLLGNPQALTRFRNEANTYTSLNHENIVRVLSQGQAEDARAYMVMELLEGDSLDKVLSTCGRLDPDSFFEIFSQLIDALKYAHSLGLIHRDIKPSNILILTQAGMRKAMLMDFGIAKWVDENTSGQAATRTGAVLGSSAYMSPEQCIGSSKIDARSDIYSLACVMFESLTGNALFQGDSAFDLMYKHLNETLSQLLHLNYMPASIQTILRKCLEKDPDNRYQTAEALARDFASAKLMGDTLKRRWHQGHAVSKKTPGTFPLLLVCAALLFVSFSVFFVIQFNKKEKGLAAGFNDDKAGRSLLVPIGVDRLSGKINEYNKELKFEKGLSLLQSWQEIHGLRQDMNQRDIARVRYLFCRQHAILGQKEKAIEYLDQILDCDEISEYLPELIVILEQHCANEGKEEDLLRVLEQRFKEKDNLKNSFICSLAKDGFVSRYYLSRGNYARASEVLSSLNKQALAEGKLDESMLDVRFNLIKALYGCRQKIEAQKIIAQCLSRPGNDEKKGIILARLAGVLSDCGDLEQACLLDRKAVEIFLQKGSYYLATEVGIHLSTLLAEIKNDNEAISLCKNLIARCPDNSDRVRLLLQLSYNFQSAGKESEALDFARRAERLSWRLFDADAEKSDFCAPAQRIYSDVLNRYGDLLYLKEHKPELQSNLNSWIERLERKAPASLLMIRLYAHKAKILQQEGKNDEALGYCHKALALLSKPSLQRKLIMHQDKPDAHVHNLYLLEKCILAAKNEHLAASHAAGKAYDHLRRCSSGEILCDSALAEASELVYAGKKESAVKLLKKVEACLPKDGVSLTIASAQKLRAYAELCLQCGKYDIADRTMRNTIKGLNLHYGKNAKIPLDFYCQLAHVYFLQGKYKECIDELRPHLNLSAQAPFSDVYCSSLNLMHYSFANLKDYQQVVVFAEKALAAARTKADKLPVYSQLAYSYRSLSDRNKERRSLEEALAICRKEAKKDKFQFQERLARLNAEDAANR